MATARDIMTGGAECIGENDDRSRTRRSARDLDVGAMPICGEDDRLKGMLTDRDIVVKALAQGNRSERDARPVSSARASR